METTLSASFKTGSLGSISTSLSLMTKPAFNEKGEFSLRIVLLLQETEGGLFCFHFFNSLFKFFLQAITPGVVNFHM